MTPPSSILILGAGAAGAQAAQTLRQMGYDGHIDLIGAEDLAPYERPPLSKDLLTGRHSEPAWLLDEAALRALSIRTRLGTPVSPSPGNSIIIVPMRANISMKAAASAGRNVTSMRI